MAETNFAFFNREDFLKHPACRSLYQYAVNAERFFRNNEDLCAINARRFIEVYIRFVSFDIKKASYPGDCLCIGSYYTRENKQEFYRVFGVNNAELIIQLNDATKPFFHPAMDRQDELYKVVVRNIFKLSWWMYSQLYPNEGKKQPDFHKEYLPTDPGIIKEDAQKITEEEKYSRIGTYFPDCDTRKIFQVEHVNGQYVIYDLNGKELNRVPDKDKYDDIADEASRLWKLLEEMVNERDRLLEQFESAQDRHLKQIDEANRKIASMQNVIKEGSDLAGTMKLQLLEKEKELLSSKNEAERALVELSERYEEEKRILDERYSNVEIRLAQVAEENHFFKKKLEELSRSREVEKYLAVVNSSLTGMKKGYEVYAGNKNEQELRSWLLKVKNYYEDQLNRKDRENASLKYENDALKKENDKLWNDLYEAATAAQPTVEPATVTENKKNRKKKKNTPLVIMLVLSAAVLFLLLGAYLMKLLSPKTSGDENDEEKYAAANMAEEKTEAETKVENDTGKEIPDESAPAENEESSDEVEPAENTEITDETESEVTDETENAAVTSPVTEENTDDDNRLPNADELYSNIQPRYEPAESIILISGVNPDLVWDIQHTNRAFFKKHNITEQIIYNHSDEMDYLGEYGMPVVNATNAYRDLSAWVGSHKRLMRLKASKVYKFVYHMGVESEKLGDYAAAIMPEDLCDGIDNNSSLDDFIKLLGSDPKKVGMNSGWTEMSTSESEHGWLFQLKNTDGVICFFDDEGKLCDYLYLYIAEGRE